MPCKNSNDRYRSTRYVGRIYEGFCNILPHITINDRLKLPEYFRLPHNPLDDMKVNMC